ncbi:MAG: methyltransferase domain-containing protein [Kofleriaceae bacterium]
MLASSPSRADLFRLLGDEDRLRLLALCEGEELTVGELATLLGESQPQVTKKSQPLREAGLLLARREGTRTLLRAPAPAPGDAVLAAAFGEGRALCIRDGSLARVAGIVAARDELSRRFFEQASADAEVTTPSPAPSLSSWLPLLAPLLPGRALAVDVGTGEGTLLPLLSPLYERVIAVDRSAARLARCAARVAAWGLPNVRLREGAVEDADVAEEVVGRGGADLVLMVRVLHHAARPAEAIHAAARLLRAGGHLVLVELLPHEDERVREQGHVWLGFEPATLRDHLAGAGLTPIASTPLPTAPVDEPLPMQVAVGRRGARLALVEADARAPVPAS